jgi:hypothetical protein
MRLALRTVPWLIAVIGLGIPLVAGGFAGWPYVVGWAIAGVTFAIARRTSRTLREFGRPALLLPVLFVLGLVGGWYLIPADLAWWVIETRDRRTGPGPTRLPAGTP